METAIYIFQRIQSVLGTLQITSIRSNLDTLLGCMQLCDQGIESLNNAISATTKTNEATSSANTTKTNADTATKKSENNEPINDAACAASSAQDAKEVMEAS